MFANLKQYFEKNKNRPGMKYGVPAVLLVSAYFFLPEDYKLQFKKKIKDDTSVREYDRKDDTNSDKK